MSEQDQTLVVDLPKPPPIPEQIGRYRIDQVLGEGSMGVVYKAFDTLLERTVALKTIRRDYLDSSREEELLARLRREARAAGRLTHPNIVAVYDYGEQENAAYIAMEFVAGKDLMDFLDEGRQFTPVEAARVVGQLLEALAYAHSHGVIHRDIKPSNMRLLPDGTVKVTDFGIARIEKDPSLTQEGMVMGSPNYMSPEQCMGKPADARSDLFSAGVVLYQMLTGERPFPGGSATVIMHRILRTEPDPPSQLNVLLPADLDQVVAQALAKRPGKRFQDAGEFLKALRGAARRVAQETGEHLEMTTGLSEDETPSRPRRLPMPLILGSSGALVVVAAAVAVVLLLPSDDGPPPEPMPEPTPEPTPEQTQSVPQPATARTEPLAPVIDTPGRPQPSAAAEPGAISVISRPEGAMVLVDDNRFLGVTPVELSLPPGHYEVVLRKRGFHDLAVNLEVEAASRIPLELDMVSSEE